METLIADNISLILLLPLWIFLIIMCGRFFSVYVNKYIVYVLTLISSAYGAICTGTSLLKFENTIEWSLPFIKINNFVINFGLHIDKLSLILAFILFLVSIAVQLFSVSFMRAEKKNYRFFALLNLFNFGMAAMFFSPNLFQMYIFWELVGIVSYLLIGFEYKNIQKSEASRRVFLINRFGDVALIAGIILSSSFILEYSSNSSFVTLSFVDMNAISTLIMAYTSDTMFLTLCVLFIIAAMVKSAQIPFHTWLQDAMEAKIPVSALLHSATMVVSGVYLIIRLMPFFTLSGTIMNVILSVGILTALVSSCLASIETEPKKVLAYSTSANLGLMFFALGMENIRAAILFLAAHAFIKSMLFMNLPKENKLSKVELIIFIAGALSLGGLLFAGCGVKEILFKASINPLYSYIFLAIAFVTAFYITRLSFLIYKKSEKTEDKNWIEILASLMLLGFNVFLYIKLRGCYHISEPYVAAIGGACLAGLLYRHGYLEKFSKIPKFIEKTYSLFIPKLYTKFAISLNIFENKIVSNYKPITALSKAVVKLSNFIETNIMNKSVTLTAGAINNLSKLDMKLQTKQVQNYNVYAFVIISIIITLVVASCAIILTDGMY